MPQTTLLNIAQDEQAQMLAALRRARYGYLLALHVLLLCAAGHTPTAIAPFLFCSRSSVYRIVRAYRAGTLGWTVDLDGRSAPVRRPPVPSLRRSLGALLKVAPRAYGWCRTRWSCARWQRSCLPSMGSGGRQRPCGAGSTNSAGCGNAPS